MNKDVMWPVLCIGLTVAFLLYGVQAYTVNKNVMSLNKEQIEDCTYLSCETTLLGGIHCEPEPVPQPQTRFDTLNPSTGDIQ